MPDQASHPRAAHRVPSLAHWGAFSAVVQAGRVVACEPFARDPAPSPIIHALPGMVHSPLRIARPAVRRNWLRLRERSDRALRGSDDFVEIDWDTALGLLAEELSRTRSRHGHASIFGGSYGWSSAGGLHHARTLVQRFLHSGGGCTGQAGNYSWGAAQFLLPHVIGTFSPVTGRVTDWRNVLAHTELFLAFGGLPARNLQITSGGAGEHSSLQWLDRAANSNIEFVVISPVRSDLPPKLNARWIPIRPNTDTAMMLGMAHTLLAEHLYDKTFVHSCCTGFDTWRDYLLGRLDGQVKDPCWAAALCGVEAQTISDLARKAARRRTMINCTWSLQRADHGEQPYWASIALASLLGQIGLPGGGFAFGHGSINGAATPRPDVAAPRLSAGINPINRSIPVARLSDMLLNPGVPYEFNGVRGEYPDIRLIHWAGGNPFHHQQDLNKLQRAWCKPETIVVQEIWWTPTARRADIVLPATTSLERNDIGGSSRDRYLMAMKQAIPPVGQSRNDFDILCELAARSGHEHAFSQGRSEMQWLRYIYETTAANWRAAGFPLPDFDTFWTQEVAELPEPERDMVLFEDFRRDPEGAPLATPTGRIELHSATIAGFGYAACPGHPSWIEPEEWLGGAHANQWPLHLISSQPAEKLHSQLDAGELSRQSKRRGRQPVHVHPHDAQQRGIGDGDLVRVFNDRGQCLATSQWDDGLMPGVVVMSTGAWFDAEPGQLERHGNPNVLTRDRGTSPLSQGCSAMTALVDIEPWSGPDLPIRAFEPPPTAPT